MPNPKPLYFKQIEDHHDTLRVTLKTGTYFPATLALNTLAKELGVKYDAGLASTWHQERADELLARTPMQAFLCLKAAVTPHKGTGRGRASNTLTVAFTGDAKTLRKIQDISQQVMKDGLKERKYCLPVLSTPPNEPDNVVYLTFERTSLNWFV